MDQVQSGNRMDVTGLSGQVVGGIAGTDAGSLYEHNHAGNMVGNAVCRSWIG